MIIRVRVEVQAEPQEQMHGSYGNLSFNEEATLMGADFTTIAEVFRDMHALLEHVKVKRASLSKP